MYQPIDIRTLDGRKFDVLPNENIEVNMGGISLLSLADRTATYTNSFKLPRTPTNEALFEFASQVDRNNRPKLDVLINKGLFQRSASLKVIDTDTNYNCSVSFNNALDTIKNLPLDFFDTHTVIILDDYDYIPILESITRLDNTQTKLKAIFGNKTSITTALDEVDSEGNVVTRRYFGNLFISAKNYFNLLEAQHGIKIEGNLLSDTFFQNTYINMPQYGYQIEESPTGGWMLIESRVTLENSTIKVSDVIAEISKIFFSSASANGNTITMSKVNLINPPVVNTESLVKQKKVLYSGLSKTNSIRYTTEDESKKDFVSDIIIGDGEGFKELMTINSVIPKTDDVGYILNDFGNIKDKLIIMTPSSTTITRSVNLGSFIGTMFTKDCSILSMGGYYSTVLNPIFENPVLLEADGWLDPFTANDIMTKRVIFSVRLGGRFWVDTMAYNLTTGQSKIKLIKLT